MTLTTGPQHANPLHGGIPCDIADAAMGMAFASTLGPDESFTTVELKINFFRPVWEAQLKAEGWVVRRGRNLGYVECEITDSSWLRPLRPVSYLEERMPRAAKSQT